MANDLISREAALDDLREELDYTKEYDLFQQTAGLLRAVRLIKNLPAVEVPVIACSRWKYFHKQNTAVCLNCSFERDLDANFGAAVACPNCGALMK